MATSQTFTSYGRCDDDAGGIARETMDGRAERLLPERPDERLMLIGSWLLAGEHVEGGCNGSCVEGYENPPIFHHRELGVPGEGVPRDIGD
jgi:hypothetical protein